MHLLVEVSANVDEGQFVEVTHVFVFEFKKVLELQEVHDIDVVWQVKQDELHCWQIF